jgi:hypothetical protein
MSLQTGYPNEQDNSDTTEEAVVNVDDVLGLNLITEEPLKPVRERVSRPRYLKEDHLLSVRGVAYIRKNAKQRVRKSIEHKDEYKNLTNLLGFYQIWGHNLFPKARFGDFVEMCATVGKSSRRLKVLRRGYLNEDQGASREDEYAQKFSPITRIDDETTSQPQHTNNDQNSNDHLERAFLARLDGRHDWAQHQVQDQTQSQEDAFTDGIPRELTVINGTDEIAKALQSTSNALFVDQDGDDGFDVDDDLFTQISCKPTQSAP